jgi:hypothetical protein
MLSVSQDCTYPSDEPWFIPGFYYGPCCSYYSFYVGCFSVCVRSVSYVQCHRCLWVVLTLQMNLGSSLAFHRIRVAPIISFMLVDLVFVFVLCLVSNVIGFAGLSLPFR